MVLLTYFAFLGPDIKCLSKSLSTFASSLSIAIKVPSLLVGGGGGGGATEINFILLVTLKSQFLSSTSQHSVNNDRQ